MYEPYAVTVLTTEERCDFFRAAIGEKADFHFDPYDAIPLHLFLTNVALSAGSAVVLDEDYFLSTDSMMRGLRDFLDDAARPARELRLVLVCSHRKAGDALLRRVVSYFGIYDVVYDCTVREAAHETARVLASPNRRVDVLELFQGAQNGGEASDARAFEGVDARVFGAADLRVFDAGASGGAGGFGGLDGHGEALAGARGGGASAISRRGEDACGVGRDGTDVTIERNGFRVDISLNITPIV